MVFYRILFSPQLPYIYPFTLCVGCQAFYIPLSLFLRICCIIVGMSKKQQNIPISHDPLKHLTLFSEFVIGIGLMLSSLFIFWKLAEDILEKETFSFDNTIIHVIYSLRSPIMTSVMEFITFFGSGTFLTIASIVIIGFLFKYHRKDSYLFSCIFIFGVLLNTFLKDFFKRPRPDFLPLIHESSYSFPSGHAMNSFVLYTCLAYFVFRRMENRVLGYSLIIATGVLILLIGISRVYLGVHYPSDVIAGYFAGFVWFLLVLLFEKTIRTIRLFGKKDKEESY